MLGLLLYFAISIEKQYFRNGDISCDVSLMLKDCSRSRRDKGLK